MRSIPSPVLSASSEQPMSRTMQYKKVMKPLLERKRRARINQCLEELKELMVSAIQAEGENVSKLEKADVLELTVTHLRKLSQNRQLHLNPSPPPPQQQQQQVDPAAAVRRFHAGFRRCVQEVDTFFESQRRLASPQAPHHPAARGLMSHLHDCLTVMDAADKTSPIQVVPPVNATAAAAAPPVAYVRHEVSSPPLSPPSAPMAPYQKALSHLRASQQQQEQQQQQQQLLLQQQHQPNGLLMPVRVLVRDDKPVESMSMSSLTSPDCGASSSCSEDEGLDLRVGAKRRHLYASSSCYDSSDEDVWRPW